MSSLIHLFQNNKQEGPYTVDQVRALLETGAISTITLAWTDGAAEWAPLSTVLPELRQYKPEQPAQATPPQPVSQSVAILPPPPIQPGTARNGPVGTGGWISFFCIQLVVLGPLVAFGQMSNAWDSSQTAFQAFPDYKTALSFGFVGYAIVIAYGVITGIIIWSGSPKGRIVAKQFLLFSLVASIAIDVISLILMSGLPRSMQDAALRGAVSVGLSRVVYSAVWWLYFKKSKRVRNTYG